MDNKFVREKIFKGFDKLLDFETKEIWKPIPSHLFQHKYLISNKGNIKNIKKGTLRIKNAKTGYCRIMMYHDKKLYAFPVHRLVAKVFVDNPDPVNNKCVNHIDGNKLNNVYWNLEWVSNATNAQHAVDTGLTKITKKGVAQYDLNGILIKIYESQVAAAKETGIDRRYINRVCKGNKKQTCGFVFKNITNDPNEKIINLKGFKQIKKFPNYWVNQSGEIYSTKTKKFKRTKVKNNGTVYIQLTKPHPKGGQDIIEIPVQNIVAKYFVKKPSNVKVNFITHKDGNKNNNCANNLEWCYMASVKHILEL
ncbi:putative HNH endonuclease [Tupanvirus deep ocean]|uniref:HNH endonuclease n=2 Tax=Tupanvirus TaxID=2094720 RepID=A0AC62A9G7_9VIRU|nr:putative HNH endonuclease [Tupanvirus deep ocean]QKU34290.1 putative HNH endonuclease [Tupanvirus deep ocean]